MLTYFKESYKLYQSDAGSQWGAGWKEGPQSQKVQELVPFQDLIRQQEMALWKVSLLEVSGSKRGKYKIRTGLVWKAWASRDKIY